MAKSFSIGSQSIGKGPCFIVAEAGSNHNGDIKTAKRLISEATRIGADAIKFQLFEAEKLSSQGNVQEILSNYEFKRDWLLPLNQYAKSKGIIMFATPFDKEAVGLLKKIKSPVYKVASADLTNTVLIKQIAATREPIICSVGLANLQEIKETIGILSSLGNTKLALLHCITNYPTLIEELNLKVIKTLIEKFKVPVGFSDHTMDTNIPSVAVALGASIVEKHLTLSRKMEGPDHPFALEPSEFKVMVENIRNTEKSLGTGTKTIINSEKKGLKTGRRSLYASRDIPKGFIITNDVISILRPCHDIGPKDMDKVLGKMAKKKIPAFKPIRWSDLT